jgi:hypothetical protein
METIARALTFALTYAVACGGEVAETTTAGPSAQCGSPPGPPSVARGPSGRRAYAIRKLYLGDTDRQGQPSRDAWKDFGFDIDGRSTPTPDASNGLCKPDEGGESVHDDGTCGIDNSFGKYIPSFFLSRGSDPDAQEAGGFTDVLVVDDVGVARSALAVTAALVQTPPLDHAPRWDGSDVRSVEASSLSGTTLDSAKLALTGYVNERIWVGRGGANVGSVTLITSYGLAVRYPVTHVVVAARISDDGTQLLDGTISAVLPTEAANAAYFAFRDAVFCCQDEHCGDRILRQLSDILDDGSQDPARTCNAISIGLGFEASEVKLGAIVDVPSPPNQCAVDAGVDAGDAGSDG